MGKNEHGGWEVLSSRVYEEFKIFRLEKSLRLNPRTSTPTEFVRIDGLDWVNIIALTPDNLVVLVKQYRHGSERTTLEIPGGCVEKSEAPQDAALRELKEETGFSAENIRLLGTIDPIPALMSIRCHCFLAENACRTAAPVLDSGEDISVELLPLQTVQGMIVDGKISHALVVACFGLFEMKTR